MLRRRLLRLRTPLLPLGIALLAMAVGMTIAPTARASGPGPCAAPPQQQAALAPAGGVTARLSRSQGVVGTVLSMTGSRWPANATVMVDAYITWNGDRYIAAPTLARGTASADGRLTLSQFRAPPIATCSSLGGASDGGEIVFLVHTLDGRARAPILFTYLTYLLGPQIVTAPADQALAPDAQVTVNGAHWEPDEHVTLTFLVAAGSLAQAPTPPFQPVPGVATHATADSQGAFSAIMPALDEPPGTQILVVAQGTGPRYGDVSESSYSYEMLPKIFPSIHLGEIAVNPGGALTVMGSHWPAHVAGVIEYCRGENTLPGIVGLRCLGGQQLGDFQTDSAGRFSATVHMPTHAALGSVTVQARIPDATFGLAVYATAQPLAIAPTFAQAHPRLTRLIGMAPYLGGALILLMALLLAGVFLMRRRRDGRAQPVAPGA
jgi:hypothetical protein